MRLLFAETTFPILLDVYDKGEAEDLSPAERRQLAELASAYRREALAALRRN